MHYVATALAWFVLIPSSPVFAFAVVRGIQSPSMTATARTAGGAVPLWDEDQQIYVGGTVPSHDEEAVDEYLKEGMLRIFGYGSLCWGPGTGALAKKGVTTRLGRAIGYKRCWAQKSTDHRGVPSFPGIVCTLLRDEEVKKIVSHRHHPNGEEKPSMTEGVVYTIPPEHVEDCLAELDFREKGGYARDVVEVIEYETGDRVSALLYRGTLDNPAFWERALLDLPFTSAVLSVSVGPSGKNDDYLFNLDHFMSDPKVAVSSEVLQESHGDTDTSMLAKMVKRLQKQHLFFLAGCGSNQHNQLLLESKTNDARLVNNEDAHDMKEIVLCVDPSSSTRVKQLVAGGGHSALLTAAGELFLWGWNNSGQLGHLSAAEVEIEYDDSPLPVIPKLNMVIEKVALGFSHTLVIEKETGLLYGFGSNNKNQIEDNEASAMIDTPVALYPSQRFTDVAAGLFHSAVITAEGELVTFGWARYGQTLSESFWKPPDGSRLEAVACGRHHTIVMDEHNRIWTVGDNKYGQLGRATKEKTSASPQLVEGSLGEKGSGCFGIDCGWSHAVAAVKQDDKVSLFGWGRNDKGQLGLGVTGNVATPTILPTISSIVSFSCGSESTVIADHQNKVWGCGWNEHGNLGTGDDKDRLEFRPAVGARVVAPTCDTGNVLVAAGGGHVLAVRTP